MRVRNREGGREGGRDGCREMGWKRGVMEVYISKETRKTQKTGRNRQSLKFARRHGKLGSKALSLEVFFHPVSSFFPSFFLSLFLSFFSFFLV